VSANTTRGFDHCVNIGLEKWVYAKLLHPGTVTISG
jgi:hypothetical protein